MDVTVWVADDVLWLNRVEEVLEAWGGPTNRRPEKECWRIELTVRGHVDRRVTAVVIHRSLMSKVVRAEVAVRPEMIDELPALLERAAAGIQAVPELRLLESLGVIDTTEARIVENLARGLGNDEMRHHLGLSSRQLQHRLRQVYRLLDAFDKNMAMALAGRLTPYGQGDDLGR